MQQGDFICSNGSIEETRGNLGHFAQEFISSSDSSISFKWEETSPNSRYGLDIGGTLCKLVYFEPFIKDSQLPEKGNGELRRQNTNNLQSIDDPETHRFNSNRDVSRHQDSLPASVVKKECSLRTERSSQKVGQNVADKKDAKLQIQSSFNPSSISVESSKSRARKIWRSSHEPIVLPGKGTLYFKRFETWRIEEFLSLTKEHSLVTGHRAIGATGGGARKFGSQFLEIAGLQLCRADELVSLVKGIDFLTQNASQDSFIFELKGYAGGSIQRPWQSPENSSSDEESGEEIWEDMGPASPDVPRNNDSFARPVPLMGGVSGRKLGGGTASEDLKMRKSKSKCDVQSDGEVMQRVPERESLVLRNGDSLYPYLV